VRQNMSQEEKVKARVENLTKELNLNEKQVGQISELVKANVAKREVFKNQAKDARKENRDKMKAEMEATKAEMKKILTEEQFKKFEENAENRKEKMMEKRKDRIDTKTNK
jgi:periplasmic protein CpxP/Spy